MLKRLRQYLTPVVATVALAVLGPTALAVTPEITELVGDDSTEQIANTQQLTDETDRADTTDVMDDLKTEELATDPLEEGDGEDVTPAVTPDVVETQEPNHGHYVSCVAHMAKEDSSLQGGQKGAVVSYAAKQDIVLPKDNEAACAAAYAAAKAATAADGEQTEEGATQSSAKAENNIEQQKVPASSVAGEAQKESRGHGQPSGRGPGSPAQNGGGRGPK